MESHYLFRRQGSSQQPLWSSLSELLQEACLVPTQRGPQSICDPVALALPSRNSGQALAQNGVLEEERQEEETLPSLGHSRVCREDCWSPPTPSYPKFRTTPFSEGQYPHGESRDTRLWWLSFCETALKALQG